MRIDRSVWFIVLALSLQMKKQVVKLLVQSLSDHLKGLKKVEVNQVFSVSKAYAPYLLATAR